VVGQHTQADPTFHTSSAVVAAAAQAEASLEHANAPLNARAEARRAAECRLLLYRAPLRTRCARLRNSHAPHPGLGGVVFVVRGKERSVARRGVGWMAKLGVMVIQARRQLRSVRR